MKTFVITGGTDGIGRAVALACLEGGHTVAIVGRNAGKGAAFLDAAARLGAAERARGRTPRRSAGTTSAANGTTTAKVRSCRAAC